MCEIVLHTQVYRHDGGDDNSTYVSIYSDMIPVMVAMTTARRRRCARSVVPIRERSVVL